MQPRNVVDVDGLALLLWLLLIVYPHSVILLRDLCPRDMPCAPDSFFIIKRKKKINNIERSQARSMENLGSSLRTPMGYGGTTSSTHNNNNNNVGHCVAISASKLTIAISASLR
jgi:hypothetical protein